MEDIRTKKAKADSVLVLPPGDHPNGPLLHSLQTVEDGIFHDGLEDHLGYQTLLQLRENVGGKDKCAGQADFLNFNIPLQDLQLYDQRFLAR